MGQRWGEREREGDPQGMYEEFFFPFPLFATVGMFVQMC